MGTVRSLLADLRAGATRERTDGTTRRRPGDAARAVIAALLLIPLILHAHHPTATEEAVVRLYDSIPHGARTLFLILYQLAALWAVGLLVVTVLLLRRWRLARDLAVGGAAAWVLGRLIAFLVHDTGLWDAFRVTFDLTGAPRFPMVRLDGRGGDGAGGVAPPGPADPPLRRGSRRAARALEPLPLAGVPHRPDRRHRARLGRRPRGGVRVRHPGRAAGGAAGDRRVAGLRHRGDRRAADERATGRPRGVRGHHRDRDRCASSRSGATKPTRSSSRAPGATSRTATRRRPSCRAAARRWSTRPTSACWRATRVSTRRASSSRARTGRSPCSWSSRSPGPSSTSSPTTPSATTCSTARGSSCATLHAARVAHGKLDGKHVLVDGSTPRIVGFDFASSSARFRQTAGDVAQLLAATAAIVGAERAVAAAVRVMGRETVAAALPILQAPALSGWTHDAFGGRDQLDDRLDELRTGRAPRRPAPRRPSCAGSSGCSRAAC